MITPQAKFPTIQHRALLPQLVSSLHIRRKPAVKTMAIAQSAIPSDYGFVCFTLFASVIVHHIYMSVSVGQARKR